MTQTRRGQAFVTGLFGGAFLGTVAGVLFAPQIFAALRQVRRELSDAAGDAGVAATDAYRDVTMRAVDTVDDLQDKGRGAFGKVLSVIVKGAEEVEGRAMAAQDELDASAATAAARRSS